jgi:hypothetical protein
MIAFPHPDWFARLSAALESDEDFQAHGRWFTASVCIRVDRTAFCLRIERGLVLALTPGAGPHDLLIAGSSEQWQVLFDTDWALNRLYRSGTLLIRGSDVDVMRNWKPLFHLCQTMKRLGQSLSHPHTA